MISKKDFYLKFNVKDFMTDEKVRDCSAAANGVYIHIMCLLFNTETKGKYLLKSEGIKKFASILPKQNVEQNNKQTYQQLLEICSCVSSQLAKHLPFTENDISPALCELLENNLLFLEGNFICQKRMLRDAEISKIRSKSGKKGGDRTESKKKNPAAEEKKEESTDDILLKQTEEQNQQQNPNYNSNYNYKEEEEDNNKGVSNNMIGGAGEGNSGEKEEDRSHIDHYRGNWHLKTTPDECMRYYFSETNFLKAKEDALGILYKYLPNADMVVLEERLSAWAVVFNSYLHRSNPADDGKKPMSGPDGYPNHFHNWLSSQKDHLKNKPGIRSTAKKNETALPVGHIPQTKDLKELEKAYTYTRNK